MTNKAREKKTLLRKSYSKNSFTVFLENYWYRSGPVAWFQPMVLKG